MAIKFLKNFAPPEPLTKFQIKKLMNTLSIFNLAAFYIFHFFYKNFSKKQTAMEFFNNCSRNSDRNFAHKSSRRYLLKPIFFLSSGFPEDSPLGNTERSKFTGMKVYTPEFLGQGRISAREEIKVNFRGLRFFNKRQWDIKKGETEAWSRDQFQPEMGHLGSAGSSKEFCE